MRDPILREGEEAFKLGSHLLVFASVLPPAAYNLGVICSRRWRWHHAVSVALYAAVATWEVGQMFRHVDALRRRTL